MNHKGALFTPLNWKECAFLAGLLDHALKNQGVKKVFIAQCLETRTGFYKNDYWLQFEKKTCLQISLRSEWVFLRLTASPVVSSQATQSSFFQHLKKNIEGCRVLKVSALPQERFIQITFSKEKVLMLGILPHAPQAYLSHFDGSFISSTNGLLESPFLSQPRLLPARVWSVREELTGLKVWDHFLEALLLKTAFKKRLQAIQKNVEHQKKEIGKRLTAVTLQGDQTAQSMDVLRFGPLMQLYTPWEKDLKVKQGVSQYLFLDPLTQKELTVEVNPELGYFDQIEFFFRQAKKKKTG